MNWTPFAIPAIVALAAKAVIFFYARNASQRGLETQLYLLLLFALSIQNLAEIFIFVGSSRHAMVFVYYSASVPAIALLLHLALAVGTTKSPGVNSTNRWPLLLYLPVVLLEILLWFTDLLVIGIEPMGYTYTKISGGLYILFVVYALAYMAATFSVLVHGSIRIENVTRRMRARLILFGAAPAILVAITVITLAALGFRGFNTTITIPTAITFFLVVTAYATHQYRLFDIAFYIPWSKTRARKTAFYERIKATVAELAQLDSMQEAVNRLSSVLGCSVALISSEKPDLAAAGSAKEMLNLPVEHLRNIRHILVAQEISYTNPDIYAAMRSHSVAAVVPFFPNKHGATGWMLLGDKFSENVCTSLDFRMVEGLFGKLAELFLDQMLTLRKQLDSTFQRFEEMEMRLRETEESMANLRKERDDLMSQNISMSREQAGNNYAVVADIVSQQGTTLDEKTALFEKSIIEQALSTAQGNKSKAARLLGLRPNTLHYKLERYNITQKK